MDKVALITGSGRHRVGNVIAQSLAEDGFTIALHYRSSVEDARVTVEELRGMGVNCDSFQADVAVESEVNSMFDAVEARFGRLDVLVTTASIWESVPLEQVTANDLWRDFNVNTLGTFLSGGQQQRLTIARALSLNPEILCLDEFSIAIDPVTTMRIEDVLMELKQDMTIVLVTNLVQQARRLASRTCLLNEGRLVQCDDTELIFSENPGNQVTYDYVHGVFG